jgi:hypothetical protein
MPWPLYPKRKSPEYPLDRRLGLDDVEKRKFLTLVGLELRPLSSQSLYRLRYIPAPEEMYQLIMN